jgi:serine protease Do
MAISPRRTAVVLLAAALFAGHARADDAFDTARAVEAQMVRALDQVDDPTVSLLRKETLTDQRRGLSSLVLGGVGTGVLVRHDGGVYVLTNHHVVSGADHMEAITSDGRRHRVRIVTGDRRVDLALLAFDQPAAGLAAIDVTAQGATGAREGSWVIATGNPFFLALDGRAVATWGVLSGSRPEDANSYVESPLLQHDAEVNPGNSGGPVWDLSGRLLGLNGTIATRSVGQGAGPSHTGASFAVPTATIRAFLAGTRAPRAPVVAHEAPPPVANPPGYLGIRYRSSSQAVAGAEVTGVAAQSPAATGIGGASLQPGDVITELRVGEQVVQIRTAAEFQRALEHQPAGTVVWLRLWRQGREHAWQGRLTSRSSR